MVQDSTSRSAGSERAELEIVVEALARTPRLAKLLRFLGEKCLDGKVDEITEYNIATEVFGRSKIAFDGSIDSIARVEAHRLRKKLKEYYETEGREHAVLISLPYRSYVPEFVPRTSSAQALASSEPQADTREFESPSPESVLDDGKAHGVADVDPAQRSHHQPEKPGKRALVYAAVGLAVLLLVSFAAVRIFKRNTSASSPEIATAPSPRVSPPPANAARVPLRLLAGYDGTPQIDSAGMRWESDRYFKLGGTIRRSETSIERTSDPMLFDHWRNGNFSYEIPLTGGPYELHLYFTVSSQDLSAFSVAINGQLALQGFDVNSDAAGTNVADERIFRDVYPDKDGILRLSFNNEQGIPLLNALELLPGLSHKQLPIRIVTQPTSVTDHDGNVWHPDTYFANGHPRDQRYQVTGTPDPALYARERFGHFTYAIPVDTRGRYTLVLHFAELYFGPQASGPGGTGSRVFRVLCNGVTLLDNFDIYKEAGSLHAVTKTFYHLHPSPQGKLNLTFEPIKNNATVSAIEVIDESE